MNVESYLTVLLVPIVHEVGHFIVAKIFGQTLKFRF
jgi:membrane-associated protease RseP (regulator of RpoE activity)